MSTNPAGESPVGNGTVLRAPGWLRLSSGMVIRAVIEARLLGRKLLTLDADIAILPADRQPPTRSPEAHLNGPPGRGLAEAARALESGATDLAAARRQVR